MKIIRKKYIVLFTLFVISNIPFAQQSDIVKSDLEESERVVNESLNDTVLINKMLEASKEMFE